MIEIAATCPDHGSVSMYESEVAVVIIEFPNSGEQLQYRFMCPIDRKLHNKQAERHSVDLLLQAGVDVDYIKMNERDPRDNPPLTENDLVNFQIDLEALPRASQDS